MGDQEAIDYLLRKLQSAPINDNFIYDFAPDLVYTRQPEIFDFLERIIQSDEQNCLPADPDASGKILCGYRVMEYIAPVIENYPLPTDEFGELEVDDYKTALQQVRVWFTQNEGYVIKRDDF